MWSVETEAVIDMVPNNVLCSKKDRTLHLAFRFRRASSNKTYQPDMQNS